MKQRLAPLNCLLLYGFVACTAFTDCLEWVSGVSSELLFVSSLLRVRGQIGGAYICVTCTQVCAVKWNCVFCISHSLGE